MAELIWQGRPGRGVCCSGQAGAIAAIGVVWCLVSGAFTALTWLTASPTVVPLLGGVFAAFGAWLAAQPLRDARRRTRTTYELTAEGLTVTRSGVATQHPAATLGGVRVVEHGDGTSTLWTAPQTSSALPIIEHIPDGARVAALLDRVHLTAEDS